MFAQFLRRSFRRSSIAALSLLAMSVANAANLSSTQDYTPADTSRDNYMDRGGVWDGSSEVSNTAGDTFTLEVTNSGSTAEGLRIEVDLPEGFNYVSSSATASASGVATPTLSVNQSSDTLVFTLDSGNFDLGNGDSLEIDFGLWADSSASNGTAQLVYRYIYGAGDEISTSQNVLVKAGDSVLTLSPNTQTVGIGETASWTVSVTNTGFGGLFDVEIDQSDLFDNPSFHGASTIQTSPMLNASSAGNVYTLPYLAPGESFTFTTTADVVSCEDLGFEVFTDDHNGETSGSSVAPVMLDLDLPLVAFTAPDIELDYLLPTSVSLPVSNVAGAGAAKNFKLASNLHNLPVSISNVGGGYSYNAANGEFTLVSGSSGSDIDDTETATLTFDVTPDNTCSPGGGTITWLALYTNECDQAYLTPFETSSLQAPVGAPSLELSVDNSGPNRLATGESGSIDINLSAAEIDRIEGDPIVVDISIDNTIASINSVAETAGTLSDLGGGNYQWSVSKADALAGAIVVVDFTVSPDPCVGGQDFTVTADTEAQSVMTSSGDQCPLDSSGSATVYVTNNPGAAAQQFFDVDSGSPFEAGAPSTNNATRDNGEGEFIPISAEYSFEPGYPGQWTGSTYVDDFGGISVQSLVEGSLKIRIGTESGALGASLSVPSSAYSKTASGLNIDLSFLEGASFFNDDNVSDTRIQIEYLTTVPDVAFTPNPLEVHDPSTLSVQHRSTLTVNGGDGTGACLDGVNRVFRQTLLYSVERAVASLGISMPGTVEVCEVFDVVLSLDNVNGQDISSPLITLDTSNPDYQYVQGQVPTYGGSFNNSNISYSENGGNNPTFQYTAGADLSNNGTITVQMVRSYNSGTTASSIAATVNYDDNETNPSSTLDLETSASAAPGYVLEGQLSTVVAPNTSIQINDGRAEWSITVQNVASGTAFGSELLNQIPPYLAINETETNAANAAAHAVDITGSMTAGGQLATFDLGDMTSGEVVTLKVVADLVPGSNCNIPDSQNIVTAQWGCGPVKAQTLVKSGPNFRFAAGRLQVLHDTTQSLARLCGLGEVTIRVKNTGDSEITEVDIYELMPELSTGLSIVSGTAEYATDNAPGAFTSIPDPAGNGDSGNRYKFEIGSGKQIDIDQLVGLLNDDGSTVNEVIIRFDIETTDPNVFASSGGPSLTASGDATLFCGGSVESPGIPFAIPALLPDLSTALTVANSTLGLSAAELVPGNKQDDVIWTFEITNSGNEVAENVRVRIPITASGGSAAISGHGANDSNYTGDWIELDDIDDGETVTVTVTETLGDTCVDTVSTAEVTWGCDSSVPNNAPSEVTLPTDNDDTAEVIMNPDFVTSGGEFSQQFNRRDDARGRVRITMNNQGAKAIDLKITEVLPENVEYDDTFTPIFSSNNSSLTAVTVDAADVESPVFTFAGDMEYDESFTLEFYVRSVIQDDDRATTFPNLADEEETSNNLDPDVELGGQATVTAEYANSCGNASDLLIEPTVDPRQPDLDIKLVANNGSETDDLTNRIVFPGVEETFNIYVRNEGENGSFAANNTIVVTLGTGWTNPSVTLDGSGTTGTGGVFTFDSSSVGRIAKNSEVHIQVKATPSGVAADPLSLQVDVDSSQILEDASTVGVELSQDSRAFRVLAVDVEKELVIGSTTEDFTTGERDLAIGEEATFNLSVKFSGGTSDSNQISDLVIRDSLGNSGAANRGLGLVSVGVTSTELVPTITTNPNGMDSADPLKSGVIDFSLSAPGAIVPANDEFTASIVARLLNDTNIDANNSDNKSIVNNLGLSLDYYGVTYRSNDSDDGFSSGVARAGLHDQEAIIVQRPELSVDKQVRNVTDGGSFAATATGEATDVFEYRVVLTNSDTSTVSVPIFDISWTDDLNAKLELFDGSITSAYKPGADTTGNGSVDIELSAAGVTSGVGGQLVVNATTLPINDSGEDLTRLNPGESITLHYFARAIQGVNPSEVLDDSVTVVGDTLPGDSGSQTSPTGATGDDDGALELSATGTASINVFSVEQAKTIITTSVGEDTSTQVLIGEQIEFEVEITLPQGTAPDLEIMDSLSEEFQLIEIGAVSVGSAITPTNAPPVITPAEAGLPANGNPLELTWSFGDTAVVAGSEEERTITVLYTVQVRNLDLASLQKGGTFTNSARYVFDGSPNDIADVTLTTAEAELVVTKSASPNKDLVAGDEVTYTVTIDNASGTAVAYDLNIVDTLPAGLTYKAGTTTTLSGAGQTIGLTGTLDEPEVDASTLTWGRLQGTPVNLDLAVSGKLVFTYVVTVTDSVEPEQELINDVEVGWTSLDGDPGPDLDVALGTAGDSNGERTDSGTAPNILQASDEATVTIDNTTKQRKDASGDTLPLDDQDDGFRVGDYVTYTVEIDVMQGTHEAFQIHDTLPSGMAFVDFEAITPASENDGFTYTALVAGTTAPSAGATGDLIFDLGTVVNAGDALTDNDTLTLVYRARILDVAAVSEPANDADSAYTEQTLSNSVTIQFLDPDGEDFSTDPVSEDIDVKQPKLEIAKERLLPAADNKVLDGEDARFRLTITNTGDAPAYNAEVMDTLPEGMRATTPTLVAATLAGVNVLSDITPNYQSTNGEWSVSLDNIQYLEPGDTLVLDYDVTLDSGLAAGQTLTNEADVTEYFSKPDDDTEERRRYDNVDPDSEDILSIISISGRVFEDININHTLNPGENWNNGVTVYVNLLLGGSVVDSYEVTSGSGDFLFEDVSSGAYTLIVTDSPSNTTPVEPPQWIFYDTPPSQGKLTLIVNDVSMHNQNLPLIQGSFIEGVVFEDTGIGGGTANDGLQNGDETGIGQVTVRLTDGGSNVYDTVQTNGEGEFTLFVPVSVADGATLTVEQFNLPSYTSTGGDAGTTAGTYTRAVDTITFTHSTGVSQSELVFGDVPANSFHTDGQQTIEPGAVAFYSHNFIAGTGGEVRFDISTVESPALPGWGQTLFLDTNCNGELDDGEPLITHPSAAIAVTAGEQICIIVKDSSPAGAPFGAQNLNTVTATFSYTNSAPALADDVLTRSDVTTIGNPTTSGLELLKAVDKEIASPGEVITYTLTYTNNGTGALDDIVIYDTTPAFTTFVAAPMPVYPQTLTDVDITAPDVGESGGIVWTFDGQLQPGEVGTVTYQVVVDQD